MYCDFQQGLKLVSYMPTVNVLSDLDPAHSSDHYRSYLHKARKRLPASVLQKQHSMGLHNRDLVGIIIGLQPRPRSTTPQSPIQEGGKKRSPTPNKKPSMQESDAISSLASSASALTPLA